MRDKQLDIRDSCNLFNSTSENVLKELSAALIVSLVNPLNSVMINTAKNVSLNMEEPLLYSQFAQQFHKKKLPIFAGSCFWFYRAKKETL